MIAEVPDWKATGDILWVKKLKRERLIFGRQHSVRRIWAHFIDHIDIMSPNIKTDKKKEQHNTVIFIILIF